jgi:hypothetical protein
MRLSLRRKPKAALDVIIDAVTTPPEVICSGCGAGTCNASGVCGQCGKSPAADLLAVSAEYPDGQSYASHAFRPTSGYPRCCHYCGMGESDPNHAAYRTAATVDRDPATGRWAKRDGSE